MAGATKDLMLTTAAAAELIGVPHHKLLYLFRSGRLPEPSRFGGRRVLGLADLEKARKLLAEVKRR